MNKNFTLHLPTMEGGTEEILTNRSLLFIGANGSGKTRLGTWIELQSPQKEKVHRISAQKSLSMPDNATPMSIDKAEKDLLYGYVNAPDQNAWQHKIGNRWNQKPAISLLNDYQKLMVYLFSDHTEESAKYLKASKETEAKVEPPTTKLDLVKLVWEKILPHRELILGGLRIQTGIKGQSNRLYNSSEMSDGERVIFYLIGQCLAAPKDGIIIVDEPEIHLHKSVQTPLWQEIEKLRPDCLFVYMTHDVDFAVSLQDTQKIWLKSYDGSRWEWEKVIEIDGLPEALLVEILGSRKPVIFVEGENGSYDVSLYRAILNDFLIIPCGSCTQVIQRVKALSNSAQLHHLDVAGLIDRDRRVDSEILSLKNDGIYTLSVAEVENLFCTPEIIRLVSARLSRNPDEDLANAIDFVTTRIKSEIEKQVSLRVASEIKYQLNCFDENATGKESLKAALSYLAQSIDVETIYTENETLIRNAVENKDYLSILKFYNRKSLAKQIGGHLGLAQGELAQFVVRIANSSDKNIVKQALTSYFGDFAEKMA